MRFEVVWHFEGIPWFENREIIGVKKPKTSPKTVEVALSTPVWLGTGVSSLVNVPGPAEAFSLMGSVTDFYKKGMNIIDKGMAVAS